MRGDYVCELCESHKLEIIYIRHTLKQENQIESESKRKQAFIRIGVRCQICGSMFLDKQFFDEWRNKQKEHRKYGNKISCKIPKVKLFIPFIQAYRRGKFGKVRADKS